MTRILILSCRGLEKPKIQSFKVRPFRSTSMNASTPVRLSKPCANAMASTGKNRSSTQQARVRRSARLSNSTGTGTTGLIDWLPVIALLVMNSLLEKEGLGGQVQTVYFDPPYGIDYRVNFQPFVNNRKETGGKDGELTSEPEMIQAFRDTWKLGIHSYLAYLRDRLLLANDLLNKTGSCFVQIGDDNVHRVSMVMDEIFGAENRVATITFATTSGMFS